MTGRDPSTYGDRIADVYDEWFGAPEDAEAAAGFLSGLAGPGPALELGIGTGRVALPLLRRGTAVHGIDASEAMVERLRAKPGGGDVPVTFGDFAEVDVGDAFTLVHVVFNTFFALLTQEDQIRCFANVARRLDTGGMFVVQTFVPDPARFVSDQLARTKRVGADEAVLECSRHDPVRQRIDSQNVVMRESGARLYPVSIRYAWPPELDLMARLAGLRLRERWADWSRSPFNARSGGHVSVYERA